MECDPITQFEMFLDELQHTEMVNDAHASSIERQMDHRRAFHVEWIGQRNLVLVQMRWEWYILDLS